MNIKLHSVNLILCAFLLAIVVNTAKAGAIRVEITPVTHTKLTQGEPIVLHYVITNESDQPMTVDMGLDGATSGTQWITRYLVSVAGEVVTATADLRPADPGGLHFNSLLIEPNAKKEGDLVASQWFSVPHPGRYTLGVHVNLTYGAEQSNEASSPYALTPPTQFEQDFSFPLTVTAFNPQRLRTLAASLERDADQAQDPRRQTLITEELTSMPESEAWPSWVKLMENVPLRGALASQLGRRPTTRTADILSQIIWPAGSSSEQIPQSEAKHQLSAMYNHSVGALKEYIRQLYAEHGINVPDQILTLNNG